MSKVKINQTVYVLDVSRRNNRELVSAEVVAVGRKYFCIKIDNWRELFFDIETLMQKTNGYSPSHILYLTREDYDYKVLHNKLLRVAKKIDFEKLNNEKLQQIITIVEDTLDVKDYETLTS